MAGGAINLMKTWKPMIDRLILALIKPTFGRDLEVRCRLGYCWPFDDPLSAHIGGMFLNV
jgi:hypothetical protein